MIRSRIRHEGANLKDAAIDRPLAAESRVGGYAAVLELDHARSRDVRRDQLGGIGMPRAIPEFHTQFPYSLTK